MLAKRDTRKRNSNQDRQVEHQSQPQLKMSQFRNEQPMARREPRRNNDRQIAEPSRSDMFSDPFGMGRDMFGGMGQMMQRFDEMSKDMMSFGNQMTAQGMSSGGGKYVSRTVTQTMKPGSNGQQHVERYETHAYGGTDQHGKKVAERKQTYFNTETGYEKKAVERKLGSQGRKVVQQKQGQDEMRSDLYHNMDERHVPEFDKAWQTSANQIGMHTQHALPGPNGRIYGQEVQPHRQPQQPYSSGSRRSEYKPDYYKREDQPVRINQQPRRDPDSFGLPYRPAQQPTRDPDQFGLPYKPSRR